MKLSTLLIITVCLLLVVAGGGYWYFFFYQTPGSDAIDDGTSPSNGFIPLNRPSGNTSTTSNNPIPSASGTDTTPNDNNASVKLPSLRLLSDTPVGGFGASTTASTTFVRWVDRGRGNVYESQSNTADIATLSNTLFPRIYDSWWNKDLNSFVLQYQDSTDGSSQYALANFVKITASSSDSSTPFQLKGNRWAKSPITVAISPRKDRIFYLIAEGDKAIGYISALDGKKETKIFETPLTQVYAEWPEENTLAITTNGSASHNGFLYFVDVKTGAWKKIIGPLPGLSTKVSKDARYVFLSGTGSAQNIVTAIFDVKTGKGTDATIRTLADKCTWGNFYKDVIYCAAAAQIPPATYPDDWYLGNLSFKDKIWQINASTMDMKLVSPLIDQSDRLIDAINLSTDGKDDFLLFMNKTDLSLWSLDLVSAQ